MTGLVQDAIYFKSLGNMQWEFGCDNEFADLIEYGTFDRPPFPFMSSTILENSKNILDSARKGCLDALKSS